ncbi:YceD family protein [Faecalimonas sp.]
MLINLSDVLTEHHKTIEQDCSIEMQEFKSELGSFPITKKENLHIVIKYIKGRELFIRGNTKFTIIIPCDRCLEDVPTEFKLDFEKTVDLSDEQENELDEKNYIDGYHLDVDKLLYNEILIGWPMKILCSDDCKGICNVCGQNLNKGTCDCEDTSLDPRMSVIRDVFKNFKEV